MLGPAPRPLGSPAGSCDVPRMSIHGANSPEHGRASRPGAQQDSAAPATAASVADIRSHFPALRRLHHGLPVAYFDGPGGTQVPQQVLAAMTDYLIHHNANTHWHFPSSQETDEIISAGRHAVADFFNASPAEIVFGANMTTLTYHLARGLGRSWGPGDELIVTELDHHANIDPWQALARERGVTVRSVPVRTADGTLDFAALEQTLSPRTRLLAIGAASNALGTVTDVTTAARLAHAVGAKVFVDAVHYAPHHLVDVQKLECDFLSCSAYKFYGPHLGILYGRQALLQSVDIPKLAPASDEAPMRLETGTQNHEAIAGARAAIDFLAALAPQAESLGRRRALQQSFAALHARGLALTEQLWQGLTALPGLTVYGLPPTGPRTPTVSFAVAGRPAAELAAALARQALFVSSGDFYATTLVRKLGCSADGLVRIGCACYTTAAEIDRLLAALRTALR